ncbi:MAG: flagellin, partial [Chloroflexota bacterium]
QMDNAIGSVDVVALDKDLNAIQSLRSQVGAKQNRVQEGTQRLSSLGITLAQLDSTIEDVDMAKAISDLATRQTTYQAALGAAAKVLPPTLLDFLH